MEWEKWTNAATGLLVVLVLVTGLLVVPGAAAASAAAAKLAAERCAKCHGKTGKGDGEGLKKLEVDVVPVDWTSKAKMARFSDADMVKIIRDGGHAAGLSKVMPPYKGKLSDAQVADLVAHIRSLAR